MVLSDPRELCKCKITARDAETPVVEHEIGELTPITAKSNSWFPCSGFPLAVAHVFDLEAVAAKHTSPPSLSLVMAEVVCESQDIPAVVW